MGSADGGRRRVRHHAVRHGNDARAARGEKGYIIVGQDTYGSITPYDLGMGGLVAKSKDFLGKRSLSRSDTAKEGRKQFVGLLTEDEQFVLPEGAQIVAKDTQVSAVDPT
ncbi:hypothetical protein M3678_12810, partial [Staphylococcus capitis]|nr:hypothetical protein [Staphylococcus capitis]